MTFERKLLSVKIFKFQGLSVTVLTSQFVIQRCSGPSKRPDANEFVVFITLRFEIDLRKQNLIENIHEVLTGFVLQMTNLYHI